VRHSDRDGSEFGGVGAVDPSVQALTYLTQARDPQPAVPIAEVRTELGATVPPRPP